MTPVFGPDDRLEKFHFLMKPADILVFDRFSLPGGLVQWADESPVNHAAIVVNAIHAIEANRVHGNKHAASRAVSRDRFIRQRSGEPHHHDLAPSGRKRPDSKGAAGRLSRSEHGNTIVKPTIRLHRCHSGRPACAAPNVRSNELRARIRLGISTAMDAYRCYQVRMCVQDNKMTLMCSEFVYRCFTESDADLAIDVGGSAPHLLLSATASPACSDHHRRRSRGRLPGLPSEVDVLWRELLSTEVRRRCRKRPASRPLTGFTGSDPDGKPG